MTSALLLSAVLIGASATVSDTFVVPVSPDALAAWVVRNSATITRAAGSQIISVHGNQFTVTRRTPRGTVEATMQATARRRQDGGLDYQCRLVPGSSDELTEYRLDCSLIPAGGRTRLSVRVFSEVTLRVRDFQLERSMRDSLGKVRALFESLRSE